MERDILFYTNSTGKANFQNKYVYVRNNNNNKTYIFIPKRAQDFEEQVKDLIQICPKVCVMKLRQNLRVSNLQLKSGCSYSYCFN